MAALGAQSIASSYEQLLHVDADGGGNSTTHVSVKDGDNGTTFGFTIASDALMMSSTNRLEFGDTGTYIHQSADGVLDLVSDTEIEINATTIDMNGAVDISGNTQLSGTVTVGVDDTGLDVKFFGATSGKFMLWDEDQDSLMFTDSTNLTFGTGNDADVYYDGTDLNINPKVVGSGRLHILGNSSAGIAGTDGTFHAHTASCGSVTAHSQADDLVVENSTTGGMSILTPDANSALIRFGSPSNNNYAAISSSYTSGAPLMEFSLLDATKMTIKSTGFVGIGDSSPDAHLDVEDATVSTTADYVGILSNHTKTAGTTANDDALFGIRSYLAHNDGDATIGNMYGGYFSTNAIASSGECASPYGSYNEVVITAGDYDETYGIRTLVDINGGVIDGNVVGHYLDVDIEGSLTMGDNIKALFILLDADTNPSGEVFGIQLFMATNSDWAWSHFDSVNSTVRSRIGALNGQIDAEGSINASQSLDYAEYFESSDGSVIAHGTTVKLDENKVVACEEGDTPLGVIRPKTAQTIVGGSQVFHWAEKYMKDDYGANIMENYTVTKWFEEITEEEYYARSKDETGGIEGGIVKDEKVEGSKAILYKEGDELPEGKEVGDEKEAAVADTYFREHKYHSDKLPEGVTAPDDAETITPGNQRQKVNPDYDSEREYSSREERDEWHVVGLLGQIPITKGQPTGSWSKMKDVSDSVEMYFVK